MRTDIRLDQVGDLPVELLMSPADGRIQLENERMVLTHMHTLGSLRAELIDTLGMVRTRGLLTRMGFAGGVRDAEMARRLVPGASDEELLQLGPSLHRLEGVAKVVPLQVRIDIAAGEFEGEFVWEQSYEALSHLASHGLHDAPVCWTMTGYACGYATSLLGKFVLFRETACLGMGHSCCRIVGKVLEQWSDAEADMKFFDPERLADQIVALQEQVSLLRHALPAAASAEGLVGASPAFLKAYALLEKVADSRSAVLLLGETGVGKEMFAKCLHALGPRRNNAFVTVNCGAIPEALVESELFGVEKGAYTGADRSRAGRFERAHGGTIFLDEMGELSPPAQVKLLRVIESGEFERVGDTRTRRADVRVVAASNRDLEARIRSGEFRSDLFFRLNSFPIRIPPLRERRDDIPLLVDHFIRSIAVCEGRRIRGITDQALGLLATEYDWPGNIRELRNVIERAVILTDDDDFIDVDRINLPVLRRAAEAEPSDGASSAMSAASIADYVVDHFIGLKEIEELILSRAVTRTSGNVSKAARLLGISRRQLAYRLDKSAHG